MTETFASQEHTPRPTDRATVSPSSTDSPRVSAPMEAFADQAIETVRRWIREAAEYPLGPAAQQLANVLQDSSGLDFTVGFVDGVIRPEDPHVAAAKLRTLAATAPQFLPGYLKAALSLGASVSRVAPRVVVPVAQRALREMVGHLIIDASEDKLGRAIARLRSDDVRLNVNLLGEAILGEQEAERRLAGTAKLLHRPDVDYVSIKVSATVAPHNHWAFDEAVEHITNKLFPLYVQAALAAPAPKFINLDMEEYKDLELTLAVFMRLLDRPELTQLSAGIVLQAYLPDALSAMQRLQEWASRRVASGGAPIKVRVVKGANLPMERVDADLHGWPLATWGSKAETDASYKAVLDYALHPERTSAIRIGVAGHNLFDIALAWHLAQARGVTDGIDVEMLLGMASGQAQAVKKDVGRLLLYTPVVHPAEFDVAIAYLVRRLEEGASHENFMSAVFDLDSNEELFEREKNRFLASLGMVSSLGVPGPHRTQDRSAEALTADSPYDDAAHPRDISFRNTPDTDPDLPGNLAWGRKILERAKNSALGAATIAAHTLTTQAQLDHVMETAASANSKWRSLSGAQRGEVLRRVGAELSARRAELLEVMASEAGKTLDQGDPEVSELIDFANYYAQLAAELDEVDGARFIPARVTVVTPPWNFPVAIPGGSTLAALAAGSSVVLKPAGPAQRCGAVLAEAIWAALEASDISTDILQLVHMSEHELGEHLLTHKLTDRVILTGSFETAQLFRSFRKDLPLLAETSGKNAIIVTPSADLDLAVKDVVSSAFGHAGQKCSAASLVVLVGSVATSRRFHRQLVDAVNSLTVGYPTDPRTQMGPLIEAPGDKLQRGLTQLGPGENWVIKPYPLDDSRKLWSPGVRAGVQRGSEYHLTEYFGPVLGVMTAASLEEAVQVVNEIDYGLTSGLHSLNQDEITYWMENIHAGNLYVNRGITGAIVQRQPFGGWKKSAIGPGSKAGGPNYLVGLGSWEDAFVALPIAGSLSATGSKVYDAATRLGLSASEHSWLREALASDAHWFGHEFSQAKDRSHLQFERNILRYRDHPVLIRFGSDGSHAHLLRVMAAAAQAGAISTQGNRVTVVASSSLPEIVDNLAQELGISVIVRDSGQWTAHLKELVGQRNSSESIRIRLIGESESTVYEATNGDPEVAIYANPVTRSGRVEMLPFFQEQAIAITAHRFGTPNHLTDDVI
ncbi:1-pyrroline-5-carboxylate dehydrogenase [Neomicrococcus aestuarii]|uniref:L-glutamate gamma-semialdehyde dehydrogenase n=2 Tax=Neomicrococcus aestuarii TaxID=556325 RepID=A0A1L2ZNS7_9MICC|nr:1-pyrroline-5-carboxylate dehydrogenase [Neomicrococcus aestuarii]